MKIGIFGGTFDPPHKGHTALCKELLERGIVDKIIVTVTFVPPHKDKKISDSIHRFNMAKIAFDGIAQISDYEIKQGGKSYTFNTLEHFSKQFPDDEIYFIVGADMFLDLPNWYNSKILLEKYKFIVIDRESTLENKAKFKEYPIGVKAIFTDIKTPSVSSTMVRDTINKGMDAIEILDENVLKYIKERKLYD